MQQFVAQWLALTPRRRLIAAAATLAMAATVYVIAGIATRPSMALLYAGLEGANAGEVLAALDQRAVSYEVRGAAIYVDSTRRDELRMDLAAQGLPANSGAGYELLDGLTGFGTTSQMFDAAYWRAKEGEIARTIAAMPNMKSVRVHISNAEPQGFRATAAPTASVSVVTRDGVLSQPHARALRFLLASAVAGMRPDDVSIIDGQGNLIGADDANESGAADDRAADLREKVLRLLEARVGPGKAVVEVARETVTDSETVSERKIDPQARVAISSETEEQTTSANDQGGTGVSVASNLPTGAAGGSGKTSQKQDSRTRERINFEVSETRRDLVRGPGATRRLTVAVLVDGIMAPPLASEGEAQWQPRPEDELTALRDLVAAAVGYDEARGDVITIRTLAFEPFSASGTEAGASLFPAFALDVMSLVQLGVLAIVALVLGLFVVRPILTARPGRMVGALPAPSPVMVAPALSGVIEEGDFMPRDLSLLNGGARNAITAAQDDLADPVARLRRLISERQEETVEILKSWMDDPEAEKA